MHLAAAAAAAVAAAAAAAAALDDIDTEDVFTFPVMAVAPGVDRLTIVARSSSRPGSEPARARSSWLLGPIERLVRRRMPLLPPSPPPLPLPTPPSAPPGYVYDPVRNRMFRVGDHAVAHALVAARESDQNAAATAAISARRRQVAGGGWVSRVASRAVAGRPSGDSGEALAAVVACVRAAADAEACGGSSVARLPAYEAVAIDARSSLACLAIRGRPNLLVAAARDDAGNVTLRQLSSGPRGPSFFHVECLALHACARGIYTAAALPGVFSHASVRVSSISRSGGSGSSYEWDHAATCLAWLPDGGAAGEMPPLFLGGSAFDASQVVRVSPEGSHSSTVVPSAGSDVLAAVPHDADDPNTVLLGLRNGGVAVWDARAPAALACYASSRIQGYASAATAADDIGGSILQWEDLEQPYVVARRRGALAVYDKRRLDEAVSVMVPTSLRPDSRAMAVVRSAGGTGASIVVGAFGNASMRPPGASSSDSASIVACWQPGAHAATAVVETAMPSCAPTAMASLAGWRSARAMPALLVTSRDALDVWQLPATRGPARGFEADDCRPVASTATPWRLVDASAADILL